MYNICMKNCENKSGRGVMLLLNKELTGDNMNEVKGEISVEIWSETKNR